MADINVAPAQAAASERIGQGYKVIWCEPSSDANLTKVFRVAVYVPIGNASSTSIGIPALEATSDTLNVSLASVATAAVTGKKI